MLDICLHSGLTTFLYFVIITITRGRYNTKRRRHRVQSKETERTIMTGKSIALCRSMNTAHFTHNVCRFCIRFNVWDFQAINAYETFISHFIQTFVRSLTFVKELALLQNVKRNIILIVMNRQRRRHDPVYTVFHKTKHCDCAVQLL